MNSGAGSLEESRVLLLGPTAKDAAMTRRILGSVGVACHACASVSELTQQVMRGAGAVILTEETLESSQIREFAEYLPQQPPWSDLPVLLLAGGGANSTSGRRAMAVLGNVTVLERPVQTASLVSVVGTLLRARHRQYELRAQLQERERAAAEREQLLASEQAARSEAERVGRIKDEFLATLSHELRTPLTAILGWSQILRSPSNTADDLEEGLQTIERNARAQTQIIEDLLDMSRIISGKIRLDVQQVDLAAVIEAALDTVRPAADAKAIQIEKSIDYSAGPVSGDPGRLQQVLWNLLSNAIKFTRSEGTVRVRLERVDAHVRVSVADTGEGIEPEFLPYVFDRFRQADASTTRRHGGLGLGLAIVKQLVELHGGTIAAHSAGRGHGATFMLLLPLPHHAIEKHAEPERRPLPAPLAALAANSCSTMLEGVRVLVVDDEPDSRALVKRLLEDCEAIVLTAASAAEAMDLVTTDPPNVLVSDIGMPREDGYSLIRRIRSLHDERLRNIPAIALTAYARAEDRAKTIGSGFQVHLTKPVEPVELVAIVATLAGRTMSSRRA